jgi:hypothetical protein
MYLVDFYFRHRVEELQAALEKSDKLCEVTFDRIAELKGQVADLIRTATVAVGEQERLYYSFFESKAVNITESINKKNR